MKKELQDKLFNDFPFLYGDRTKPMSQTCMCWGIDCGDGWYDLIYELSAKLEPTIREIKKECEKKSCYGCGCSYYKHVEMPNGHLNCLTVHKHPYRVKGGYGCCIPQWKRDFKFYGFKTKTLKRLLKQDWGYTKYQFRNKINRLLYRMYKLGLYYKKQCWCANYETPYPRASQVKEKFGTLRFYMTSATDEMFDLIHKAEERSARICEACGKEGKANLEGWISTLCEPCRDARESKWKDVYYNKEESLCPTK